MWPLAFEKSLVIDCPHNKFYLCQEIQKPSIIHDVNLHNPEIVHIYPGFEISQLSQVPCCVASMGIAYTEILPYS